MCCMLSYGQGRTFEDINASRRQGNATLTYVQKTIIPNTRETLQEKARQADFSRKL